MKTRVTMCVFVVFVLALAAQAGAQAESDRKTIQIGVVIDGPAQRLQDSLKLIASEIIALTRSAFEVKFDPKKQIVSDWQPDSIRQALDQLLADPEVDIVMANGPISSNDLVTRTDLPKPAVAPFVINKRIQVLAGPEGELKRKNLSYVVWSLNLDRDLKAFTELGQFKRIAFIGGGHIGRSIPKLLEDLVKQAEKQGVEIVPVYGEETAEVALERLPKQIDAVYLGPNPRMSMDEIEKLAAGLVERRLPSFSWFGRSEVEKGILAGLGGPEDFIRLSRRIALNIQRILQGEPPENLVTAFRLTEQLVINMTTARAVGVWPDFAVLSDAVLLGTKREAVKRKLTIHSAIQEAMKANLDLRAADKEVLAGEQEIRRARSNLLPQLDVSASGGWIDDDRAGFGQAERTVFWSATLNQSIYHQEAWANLGIQSDLQRSRKHQRHQTKLDVAADVALAYLDLLKAQTYERIQKENLRLTRSNLALARVRLQIGAAGPDEVYRWEAQVANSRRDLIGTISARNQVEIALNRLLNRPPEEPFLVEETSLNDPLLLSSEQILRDYFSNPFRFKVLREFMVYEGLKQAPELRALDASIAATQQQVDANRRALFIPDFGLQASTTHRFYTGGEGSAPAPGLPNDFDWFVGVTASLPLFEGGSRYADIRQSEHELAKLKIEKEAAQQLIEQRIRSALHQAGASFPAIKLSRDAAKAASDNLALVTDAYNRGATSIVTLLDAQNQSLISDLAAANAAYTFLSDLMAVERAVGRLDFFETPDHRDDFFRRLNAHAAKKRGRPSALPGAADR